MNKAEAPKPKTTLAGQAIGMTRSGKAIMSHAKAHEYHNFSAADHSDAADAHHTAAAEHQKLGNGKMVDHHIQKKKMHLQAMAGAKRRAERFGRGMESKIAKRNKVLGKAMTAGDSMVAPGNLSGGAALAKESIDKKIHKSAEMNGVGAPVGANFKGKDLHADQAHRKAGMGTSHMGHKVRGGDESVLSAKQIAEKNLKRIKNAPKPTLTKEEATPPPPPPPTLGQTATAGGTSTINSAIGNPFGKAEGEDAKLADAHPNDLYGKSHMVKGTMMRYARSTPAAHHFLHPTEKKVVQVKRNRPLQKSYWLERAEAEFNNWDKRDQFLEFITARMPNLTKGEAVAIGQTVALKKALEAEEALEDLSKALKFGSEEDQKKVAEAMAERAKNPPKKSEPKKKAPEVTHPMDGEVSHTSGYGEHHETVHLKSGHELHGCKKGKFKAGDKVHVKPHIMNTFLIDHKK